MAIRVFHADGTSHIIPGKIEVIVPEVKPEPEPAPAPKRKKREEKVVESEPISEDN